ncbi:MAG: S41 family peptidase [Patescibacteria group bacterium]
MKNRVKTIQIILVVIISFLSGFYFGVNKVSVDWKHFKPSISVSSKEPPSALTNVDFSLFWTVWQKLENSYYDKTKIDAQKMLNGAIDGMVGSLGDPFTIFLPPVQNTNFKEGLAGQFSGIGAELGTKDKQVIVIASLDGSPAERSGVKAGDAILKVNGEPTLNWSLSSTVEKIRGPKGTEVVLNILHKDTIKPQDIKIVRDIIRIKSVVGWIKKIKDIDSIRGLKNIKEKENDEVLYIKLSQFGDSTNKDWLSIVNSFSLHLQNKKVKGLILDLRNNPGGYLTDAVFIASEFLKQGDLIVKENTGITDEVTFRATRKGLFQEIPLVVIINKGSASASEIVSSAIRDNNRGILVGETSFGKGTIQSADDLGNGAGLHVTIAKWLTPKGTWVNNQGLKPDIEATLDSKDQSHDLQLEKAVEELVK